MCIYKESQITLQNKSQFRTQTFPLAHGQCLHRMLGVCKGFCIGIPSPSSPLPKDIVRWREETAINPWDRIQQRVPPSACGILEKIAG